MSSATLRILIRTCDSISGFLNFLLCGDQEEFFVSQERCQYERLAKLTSLGLKASKSRMTGTPFSDRYTFRKRCKPAGERRTPGISTIFPGKRMDRLTVLLQELSHLLDVCSGRPVHLCSQKTAEVSSSHCGICVIRRDSPSHSCQETSSSDELADSISRRVSCGAEVVSAAFETEKDDEEDSHMCPG